MIKYFKYNNNNFIIYFLFVKQYLKLLIFKNNNLFLLYNIILNNKYINNFYLKLSIYLKKIYNLLDNLNVLYYTKLYNIGLGFKNFIYNNFLYMYLGDSNYFKIKYNRKQIFIICKKNQLFLFSKFKYILNNFVGKIINLKKINIYKGKGIIFYKNFKFMKLKKGKKKN